MARMTIAQQRERDVEYIAHVYSGEWTEEEPNDERIAAARKLMNSFYRLNGLAERNFYYSNDSRLYDRPWVHESENREEKWYSRLKKEFKDFCGLDLFYSSFFLHIGKCYPRGGVSTVIYPKFYN